MQAATSWLKRDISENGRTTKDISWQRRSYGNLIEIGVLVESASLSYGIMCSYSDVFVRRIAGSKLEFEELRKSLEKWCNNET